MTTPRNTPNPVHMAAISSDAASGSSTPVPGRLQSQPSRDATVTAAPRSTTNVSATRTTTMTASAPTVPAIAETRRGPAVRVVFQVPQP